jgi:hypothetical protein
VRAVEHVFCRWSGTLQIAPLLILQAVSFIAVLAAADTYAQNAPCRSTAACLFCEPDSYYGATQAAHVIY